MSPAARFKRALVTLLLELARVYGLTMSLNRDSADDVVKKNFRKIMLRAHPDKAGGSEATAKRLNAAWECGSLHGRWYPLFFQYRQSGSTKPGIKFPPILYT